MSQAADRSAHHSVPVLLDLLAPASVVDVGCGAGTWSAEFRRRGVNDVVGVDGPWVSVDALEIPRDTFVRADLTHPLDLGRRFDLAISLETAEHLAPEAAAAFVGSLTALAPVVVFSAAVPQQGGTHHLNEQWPDYWVALFRARGYLLFDCMRARLWNLPEVEYWYAQNMLLFVDEGHWRAHPELARRIGEPSTQALPLVHPRKYLRLVEHIEEAADLRRRPLSDVLAVLPGMVARSVSGRIRRLFGGGGHA